MQMAVEEMQQQLLRQHSELMNKARALNSTIADDVRSLARLWQLQAKMESVGSAYDTRLARVGAARCLLQEQLCKRLALLEGYSRVASMIEIEVEMNTEVCAAEERRCVICEAQCVTVGIVYLAPTNCE
jgi:division protein CdvB (Snf7/Vps24/ESCRT-III family)